MNREIKFRVWDSQDSKFIDCVINSKDGTIGAFGKTRRFEIQQYTGIKDKNGREIYEGDILNNKTSYEEYVSPAVVVWEKYEHVGWVLAFCPKEKNYEQLKHTINGIDVYEETPLRLPRFGGDYEVIGNILENPELLK